MKDNKTKIVLYKVSNLAIDILLLLYKILRQIVLPGRRRKGNLLSSLFLFFIELAKRVIHFKHSITVSPWSYGRKYIQQGMLIATWLLFILSSFEWSAAPATRIPPASCIPPTTRIPHEPSSCLETPGSRKPSSAIAANFAAQDATALTGLPVAAGKQGIRPHLPFSRQSCYPNPVKKYLLLGILRI